MANIVIILGKSGSGKSTSIKSLEPKETVIINPLKKRLPFKGSNASYNKENKNLYNIEDSATVLRCLDAVNKRAEVKNIVLDDIVYTMRKEYFARSSERGFDKYAEIATHFQSILSYAEGLRDDLNIFFMLHSEEVESDGSIVGFKVSTIGKLVDKAYNPVEVVSVVLYSKTEYDEKGQPSYGFYTHASCVKGCEIPAKSPEGMFEEDRIPNDLGFVIEKMNEYYG